MNTERYNQFVNTHKNFIRKYVKKLDDLSIPSYDYDDARQHVATFIWEALSHPNCKNEKYRDAFVRGFVKNQISHLYRNRKQHGSYLLFPSLLEQCLQKIDAEYAMMNEDDLEHKVFLAHNIQKIWNRLYQLPPASQEFQIVHKYFAPIFENKKLPWTQAAFVKHVDTHWQACQQIMQNFLLSIGIRYHDLFDTN